ncbi:UdgX family uracil-DNA binding protein [Bordetella genomosp. 5]|uniref:Type-4 uracil-DNA glycosylase n=1 Tax=Bordetella genomosp. 5 TaxID=1395608 RepID=A0A261THF6_9BORD|nr:UdgX family uracil-DNA binding protein [Bordetella genomosp. 5]OZI49064.1 uracil-DNA glycosylase [Bordetella genomosp. 5]
MTARLPATVRVEGGYPGWRALALQALAERRAPESLSWDERIAGAEQMQMALDDAPNADASAAHPAPSPSTVRISRSLATLLQEAAHYRSPDRWGLLYRVLWRWCEGDRSAESAADPDGARLHAMAKSVRRAHHDMIAYVRFHRREDPNALGPDAPTPALAMPEALPLPRYLAWYEPEHDVLHAVADHFARRMGRESWWIGTPQGAALWDGRTMHFSDAPADASIVPIGTDRIEPLWLAYYQSIFNPARLNETALHQHMPARFWKGLPEGRLIPGMIADARAGARRVGQAQTVSAMPGKVVAVDAQRALPERALPTTLDQCRRCELWRHATQPVPGRGPETARVMLVGEQPGDQEDLAGRAFVGPAGQVLAEAMRRAGAEPDSLYLTNAVKHFKWTARGKRRMHKTPAQQEVDACLHWLEEERARVRPDVIVTLGATALHAILGRHAALQEHLHTPVWLGDAWLLPTWHPSYALRATGENAREEITAAIAQAIARAQAMVGSGAPARGPASA